MINKNNTSIPDLLIKNLGSSLKIKRQSAVEEFINKNYAIADLNKYIHTKNHNFFSSFIQISSLSNFDNKINCWDQFENYFYENYKTDMEFNSTGFKHIINSLKKYFFNKEIFAFYNHLENINIKITKLRKDLLKTSEFNNDDDIISYAIFWVNKEYDTSLDFNTIDQKTIDLASRLSIKPLDEMLYKYASESDKKRFYYFYFLKDNLLYFFYTKTTDKDVLIDFIEKDRIPNLVGIDSIYHNSLKKSVETKLLSITHSNRKFNEMFDNYYSSTDLAEKLSLLREIYFLNLNAKTDYLNSITEEFKKIKEEFYKVLLNENNIEMRKKLLTNYYFIAALFIEFWRPNISEFLKKALTGPDFNYVIKKIKIAEDLYFDNNMKWKVYYVDFMDFIFFSQETVIMEPTRVCCFTPENISDKTLISKLEDKLLKIIEQSNIFYESLNKDDKNSILQRNRFYFALEFLLPCGNTYAFYITKDLYYFSQTNDIKLPVTNFFEFNLFDYIRAKGEFRKIRKILFNIGDRWEQICNLIASKKYTNILSEFNNETRLINNSIPDIIVNKNIKYCNNLIEGADLIIECKSSLYFLTENNDLVNNDNVQLYLPYCKQLQIWVLQEFKDFEKLDTHDRVKYVFATEFLDDSSIDKKIKEDISSLLYFRKNTPTSFKDFTPEQLIRYIDTFILK